MPTLPIELHPGPVRTDLTDRECTHVVGSAIGALLQMSSPSQIKRALLWWAQNVDAVDAMAQQNERLGEIGQRTADAVLAQRAEKSEQEQGDS